jgi:AcrR family transcriptional regulator
MPKIVDHDARRRELADALLRVAVRDGIDAVSIRTVAAEAGCSARPVQYYFADKAALLAAAHHRVSERMGSLVTEAVHALGNAPHPRAVIEAIVHTFLPSTDAARDAVVAYHCFFAAELTDPGLRVPDAAAAPTGLGRVIRQQIERDRGGELNDGEARDVTLLVLCLSTLAASVIAGYRTLEDARALLDHQIDRLLPGPDPTSQ